MAVDIEEIITLERANYEASESIIANMPGTDLELRDDVVLTRSVVFPAPDTNHACLLRTLPEKADDLIAQVIDYYQSKELPPTIFISPACTPDDLPQRLLRHGFTQQETEAWLVYENISTATAPRLSDKVPIKPITKDEVSIFVDVFMKSFELSPELAESMIEVIEPSVGLPGMYHYLGYLDDEPVGTFSLLCYKEFGILGSAGVIPHKRRRMVVANLLIGAGVQAQSNGVDTLMLQTTGGAVFERLLRISGFKKVFSRTSYTLE